MQSELIRGIYFFNQAGVLYYARERYYRHVQTSVLEVLKKYGSDPVLLFWKAYGIIMEGTVDITAVMLQRMWYVRMCISDKSLVLQAHESLACETIIASSPDHSQILSHSRGEKSEEGLGSLVCHKLEVVDTVSTN